MTVPSKAAGGSTPCLRPTTKPSSSSSGGLLSRVGLSQPSLTVELEEDLLFLHPTPKGEPSQDPVLEGSVTLYLPKPRVLTNLTVRLLGRQDISFGDLRASESHITLQKDVSLLHDTETLLEKGTHRLAFSIIVPSSTACHEKCQWGRTWHTVQARAKGLGQLGGEVSSEMKRVTLVVNPGGAGANEPPPVLNLRYEGVLEDLGPYSISLQSQHLMVGGLLLLRLFLLSPPSTLTLHSIKIKILQHFHATSPTDSSRTAVLPVDSRTVMHLHGGAGAGPNFGKVDEAPSASNSRKSDSVGSPLRRLERGEGWRMHHLGRLPDHEMLRPSTNEWSETGLRVGHEMGVEVVYQVGEGVREKGRKGKGKDEGEVKKMVLKRGLELFSCCATVDSLTLPPYSGIDDSTLESEPSCVCSYPISALVAHYGHGANLNLSSSEDDETTLRGSIVSALDGGPTPKTVKLGSSGYQTPEGVE